MSLLLSTTAWAPPKPAGMGVLLLALSITLVVISSIVFGVRIYARARATFAVEDYLMSIGVVLNLGTHALVVYSVIGRGIGMKQPMTNIIAVDKVLEVVWYFGTLLNISCLFIRASICVFLTRLTVQRRYIYFIYVVMSFSIASNLTAVVALLVRCRPISGWWNIMAADNNCFDYTIMVNIVKACYVTNIIVDFSVALTPIVLIWDLRMSKKLKFSASTVMGLGVIASIGTIMRLPYTDYTSGNLSETIAASMLWCIYEIDIGIIAASLPMIKHHFGIGRGTARRLAGVDELGPMVTIGQIRNHKHTTSDATSSVMGDGDGDTELPGVDRVNSQRSSGRFIEDIE